MSLFVNFSNFLEIFDIFNIIFEWVSAFTFHIFLFDTELDSYFCQNSKFSFISTLYFFLVRRRFCFTTGLFTNIDKSEVKDICNNSNELENLL